MVGFIVMLSDLMSRRFYLINRKDNDSNSKGNFIIMILGFICLILGPVFAQLMKLALSRRREFLADASAVEFTRNPDAFISALQNWILTIQNLVRLIMQLHICFHKSI